MGQLNPYEKSVMKKGKILYKSQNKKEYFKYKLRISTSKAKPEKSKLNIKVYFNSKVISPEHI